MSFGESTLTLQMSTRENIVWPKFGDKNQLNVSLQRIIPAFDLKILARNNFYMLQTSDCYQDHRQALNAFLIVEH